jgi:hypothetical protein
LPDAVTADFSRRFAAQGRMCTRMIVVILESVQFPFKVLSIPEEGATKKLMGKDSDESIKGCKRSVWRITLQPSTSAVPADPTNQSSV